MIDIDVDRRRRGMPVYNTLLLNKFGMIYVIFFSLNRDIFSKIFDFHEIRDYCLFKGKSI